MAITDRFVLPADVVLAPVESLSQDVRAQFEAEDGDFAVTRPRSRTASSIIGASAAELLQSFRSPISVIEAIIQYSERRQTDPRTMLAEAFPMIERLINSNLLVEADSEEAKRIIQTLEIGDKFQDFEVVRCVQVLEDTELYQLRKSDGEEAALKLARAGYAASVRRMFEREAAVLQRLDGKVNPRLLASGEFEENPYLIIEWCVGVNASVAAHELRRKSGEAERAELLNLCLVLLEAYAHLHAQGVIHSDVHPRNVLIGPNNEVKIIDYGLARLDDLSSPLRKARRGGVHHYFEPEFAAARTAGKHPQPSSMAGEQYGLAAMLYQLITGQDYLDFAAEKEKAFRQIMEEAPLPFSRRGVSPWPEAEELLGRALSKQPKERFLSVAEFARKLAAIKYVPSEIENNTTSAALAQGSQSIREGILKRLLQNVGPEGPLFMEGYRMTPTCSVNYGAAGLAYALYRLACIQDDPGLLSLADLWITKAVSGMDSSSAFYSTDIEITPETVGRISPYHTASGLYLVQAFVSNAMCDIPTQGPAIEAFIAASQAPCDSLDLTLGLSGSLLASALVLDTIPVELSGSRSMLIDFGERVYEQIWNKASQFAPIPECRDLSSLGIAHGWSGLVYSALRWLQVMGKPIPATVYERLEQLVECAESKGRGVRWKVRIRRSKHNSGSDYMTSWCNGSPGFVFLWTLAHELSGSQEFLQLAERAAWNTYEDTEQIDSLCCGLAGAGYSLLNLYKYTGDKQWLNRAHEFAKRATEARTYSQTPESLYKGQLGVALLLADLEKPETACMPLFEPEGWPSPSISSVGSS